MAIALTLEQYLDAQGVTYDCIEHKRTACSMRTAQAAHVPLECLAKAVLLRRRDGYLVAIVPASRQVGLDQVGHWLGQPIAMASEDDAVELFPDCARGAIPAVAAAYGLQGIVDDSLESRRDIYLEGGDHRTLVHLTAAQFHRLMEKVPHGQICAEATGPGSDDPYYSGA
jgi:Ala-tRNA(Pro) deacylase